MNEPVCAVVGVGPGNGAAIARKFAAEGYAIALVARSPELTDDLVRDFGPPARAYRCDAADPVELRATFDGRRSTRSRTSSGRWTSSSTTLVPEGGGPSRRSL